MFGAVLVANRGEIAVRVIHTLRRLGIRAVAVHSDADDHAPHVALADTAIRIGPGPAAESYLVIERVVEAALRSRAHAVHPGYGFLAENPAFARAVADAGLTFIGPPPEAMELLGDKVAAKRAAQAAGVPVVPGLARPGLTDEDIAAFAAEPGALPLMVKAAAGGGGRGMRIVRSRDDLSDALAAARREARAGFGDDGLLAERYVERARHIEIQVLADAHGSAIHLGERECSLQRRHQKVVEETPSPVVTPELRERMGAAAVALARHAGYAGAGTVEFLVSDEDPDDFFFLEMNARLQVEHPVTELVTGVDLVEAQLRVAAGEPLWLAQGDVSFQGHAVEARINAEDPARDFLPGSGRVVGYREPSGPGIRVDSGIATGVEVSTYYDSLLLKVIAHAAWRDAALDRLDGALAHLAVLGPPTNTAFLRRLIADDDVRRGAVHTELIAQRPPAPPEGASVAAAAAAAALARTLELIEDARGDDPWDTLVGWRPAGRAPLRWRLQPAHGGDAVEVVVAGPPDAAAVTVGDQKWAAAAAFADRRTTLLVSLDGERRPWSHARDGEVTWLGEGGVTWAFRDEEVTLRGHGERAGAALDAPMPGTVLLVKVAEGDRVAEGDVLVVLESMKMELSVSAPMDGVVRSLPVSAGERVTLGQPLVDLAPEAA